MKKFLYLAILPLIAAAQVLAQTSAEPPLPIVGGYQSAPVDDADIRAAADFAVTAAPKPYKLREIVSARQQVVAGMNYSLCLRVSSKGGLFSRGRFVAAKVFRDLQQHYALTSWQDVKTCT